MKRIVISLLILFPATIEAKVAVVTTIPDLAALTQEVGKDLVDVTSLAHPNEDPHYLEPKPSYALNLNRADLLVENGLDLEIGWLPVLLTQSRNPKIQAGMVGHLDASEGLKILEIPTGVVDRSQGDVHPLGNPHYLLKPQNDLEVARRIADRLGEIDPPNKAHYQENFARFEQEMKTKIGQWEKRLAPFRGKKIITYHKSFSYFADWAGLTVAGLIEPKPGIPPSGSHIESSIQLIKAQKIPFIAMENYYDPKPAQELAVRTGAKVLILPTSVGSEPAIKTTLDLFDRLVQKMTEAL